MRGIFQLICFIVAFNINITVKAGDSDASSRSFVMTAPKGCLEPAQYPCILKSNKNMYEYEGSHFKFYSDSDLTVQIDGKKDLTLVSGRIWVEVKRSLNVYFTSGKALLSQGIHEIEFSKDRTFFRPIKGRVLLSPKGHENPVELPLGYENEVMSVARNGKSVVGVPRPAELKQVLYGAGLFFRTEKRKYNSEMKAYYKHWSDAIENASRMNRYIAARENKKHDEAEHRWLERKRQREAERSQMRQKFWNKVFK